MTSAGLQPLTVPRQQNLPEAFPLVYGPAAGGSDFAAAVAAIADAKDQLLASLERHGAILLRGFPVASAEQFDALVAAFGLPNFSYSESLSNAVRVTLTERVFTANEAPHTVSIFLHHEMAQTPYYPSRLFFFCETPPAAGGETPLCRSDVLYRMMRQQVPDFVDACERLGVRYTNVMPAGDDAASGQGRSWSSTLRAGSRQEAEARLQRLNYEWRWLAEGALQVTTKALPAVRRLSDGRKVFFNQVIAAYRGWKGARNASYRPVCFGDDSALPDAAMERVCDWADRLSFDLAWRRGDVALVDNVLVMHGRRPFEGRRRILASLAADPPPPVQTAAAGNNPGC